MAKDNIMAKHRIVYIFWLSVIVCCLQSCYNVASKNDYYRYYVGMMEINKPIQVTFHDMDEGDFVCPDSILYCINDSDWTERSDVYPYIMIVDSPDRYYKDYYPTYNVNKLKFFLDRTWNFKYAYSDFLSYDSVNRISYCKFYYDLTLFDMYMQATDVEWYDPSDPNGTNQWADCYESLRYSDRYRIAVRQHYSTWQIIKLKVKNHIIHRKNKTNEMTKL